MSAERSIPRPTRNRFVWLGAASLLVAATFVGAAVWSDSSSLGYPAVVAGIFGVVFLGVAFPALDRAVRGFLGLWMLAGGWMFITTAPIALFQALSRWMLERQPPLTLQVTVLVLWGVLLTGAISLIATEGSRVRLYAALSRIGALAPLVYTFNVLFIAMVFFAVC